SFAEEDTFSPVTNTPVTNVPAGSESLPPLSVDNKECPISDIPAGDCTGNTLDTGIIRDSDEPTLNEKQCEDVDPTTGDCSTETVEPDGGDAGGTPTPTPPPDPS